MTDQQKTATFRALHVPGTPVVLVNVWDAGSAKAVTDAGAPALATGSWSVAAAHGFADGEQLPLDVAVANLTRIVGATELPVSVDLESGYGADAAAVAATFMQAVEVGAVGCNLEDSLPGDGSLRPTDEQVARITSARKAVGADFFINGRTDVFFQKPPEEHDASMVKDALERAKAYADAGADGLFVPGLVNPELIAEVVQGSSLPVNIMVMDDSLTVAQLAALGVARISQGPGPYLRAMKALEDDARAALGTIQG